MDRVWKCRLLVFLILLLTLAAGLVSAADFRQERLQVFVSILPQKFFVERIGGDAVQVSVLVGPGQSPAVYEPLPQQMAALAEAALYFRIGVPFETIWMGRIEELNPRLKVVDTRQGLQLRRIEGARGGQAELEVADPLLVKVQGETIYKELSLADPSKRDFYGQNLAEFLAELEQLHQELAAIFSSLPTPKLMVFHPAWGYLADRYGLEQIPIEVEGKEPGPRALAEFVQLAETEGIKVIFVEEQSSAQAAYSVAEAVGAKVVKIDPLAEDYLSNLRQIARVIQKEQEQ